MYLQKHSNGEAVENAAAALKEGSFQEEGRGPPVQCFRQANVIDCTQGSLLTVVLGRVVNLKLRCLLHLKEGSVSQS